MHLTVNSPRGQLALNKLAATKGNSLAENDAGQSYIFIRKHFLAYFLLFF